MSTPHNSNYEFGLFLEPHARRLSCHGESVPLAAPEFEILLLLVRNRGRVVEKNEIMEAVWPDAAVEENNLTVRMSSLRRSLGETKGDHQYIQTVTGRGYCLIAKVRERNSQPGTATPEATSKTQALPELAIRQSVDFEQRSAVAGTKWSIKSFRLYALLLVGAAALPSARPVGCISLLSARTSLRRWRTENSWRVL